MLENALENMHMIHGFLCFVSVGQGSVYPYPAG